MKTIPRTFVVSALAAAGLVTMLLSGCAATPAPTSAQGSSASSSSGTAKQTYDQWELQYKSCLSGKGFDLPATEGKIDFGNRQPSFDAASDACIKTIGDPPPATSDQPNESHTEVQAKMLAIVNCLRDRGYTLDDPKDTTVVVPDDVSQADINACAAR